MKKNKKEDLSGLGIPAGLFMGMGVGFLINEVVAGLFLGLGTGFLLMILIKILTKNKKN